MLLLSCATAQNTAGPATLQSVTTARQGAELRVEVTLSCAVKPSFDTVSNPDRILLDLPDTRPPHERITNGACLLRGFALENVTALVTEVEQGS